MAGLGVEKLEKLMPEIVATASKMDIAPHVRDGYIMMFNYLPITFGDKFTPYVGPIIPCILKVGTIDHVEGSVLRSQYAWVLLERQGSLPIGNRWQKAPSCSSGSSNSFWVWVPKGRQP